MSKEAMNKLLEAVIELERSIREAESYVKSTSLSENISSSAVSE